MEIVITKWNNGEYEIYQACDSGYMNFGTAEISYHIEEGAEVITRFESVEKLAELISQGDSKMPDEIKKEEGIKISAWDELWDWIIRYSSFTEEQLRNGTGVIIRCSPAESITVEITNIVNDEMEEIRDEQD